MYSIILFSMGALSVMTLNIMTLSIMTICILTKMLNLMTFSMMIPISIMTMGMTRQGIRTLSVIFVNMAVIFHKLS
jgi:hypothetical protein